MKRKDILEELVTDSAYPGKGVFSAEGKTVEVKNALPGQKVRCRIKKIKHGKAEGRLLEVLEKAPYETEPDCPHFSVCGGCAYRRISVEKQRELKEHQMTSLLDAYLAPGVWEGLFASPDTYEYRNKMEFSFGDAYKGGPLSLGMHKAGGHYDIVTVDGCRIVDGDYRAVLSYTLDFFAGTGLPFFHTITHEGYLRHLLVRKGSRTGELMADLVTSSQTSFFKEEPEEQVLARWTAGLKELELSVPVVSVLHTVNDSPADIIKDEGTTVLSGRPWITEKLFDLEFRITPFSFFQTNTRGAEVLYSIVRDYVGDLDGASVYDLYCGTGTITQVLAETADHVTGVEIVEEAVEAAKENAQANGLSNCEFICGDVLRVIGDLKEQKEQPDVIVLDPPRDGIHPKALPQILECAPERIVYVSCKPTSLLRDLEIITAAGYEVGRACAVDLFPGTKHVECVTMMTKK